MTTDNFCFHSQNRLIQTSQTGGQWYSDSPFGIPWSDHGQLVYGLTDGRKYTWIDENGQLFEFQELNGIVR
jgi:hypothetical protein